VCAVSPSLIRHGHVSVERVVSISWASCFIYLCVCLFDDSFGHSSYHNVADRQTDRRSYVNIARPYMPTGAQPRLKSWGGPKFGSQHRGACPGWGWVLEGSPPPAMGVRGVTPGNFFENSDAKSCILVASALISGLRGRVYPSKQQACQGLSVPKFQLFSRGCGPGC